MNAAQILAEMRVEDLAGREVRLGSLWADRNAVVAFLPSFCSLFCAQHWAHLREAFRQTRHSGAHWAVIGTGDPESAREFARRHRARVQLLVDPSARTYRAVALPSGLAAVHSRLTRQIIQALRAGYRNEPSSGDRWQAGGLFVFAPGDEVRFAFAGGTAGDLVPVAELAAALGSAPARAPLRAGPAALQPGLAT
jgi:peroxiredoxin